MSFIGAAIGVAGVAANLYGSSQQASAAGNAANVQAQGIGAGIGLQRQALAQTQANNQPYLDAGAGAIGSLDNYLGLGSSSPGSQILPNGQTVEQAAEQMWDANHAATPGGNADRATYKATDPSGYQTILGQYENQVEANNPNLSTTGGDSNTGSLLKPFSAADLNTNLAPNYGFMLSQGQGATNNINNASGGLIGGNALQGIDTFTQNYAQNAYQQAYNNYNTNQQNIYNRLSGVAQLGQASANNVGAQSIQGSANIAAGTAAQGAALGGGIVGGANATAQGLNNASSTGLLSSILNNNSTGAVSQGAFIDPNSGPVSGGGGVVNDTTG